jgi:hypothetical protein
MLDTFSSDFSVDSLIAAVTRVPYVPGRTGELGLFETFTIPTTTATMEELAEEVALVQSSARGAPAPAITLPRRTARSFSVVRLAEEGGVTVDEVLNARAFGSAARETIQNRRDRMVGRLRAGIEATLEYHRMEAIKGLVKDADGSTILDIYTELGQTQTSVGMALNSTSTKVRTKILSVLSAIEEALDGVAFTGVRVLCGAAFWEALVEHENVVSTYLGTQAAADLRGDPRMEFTYGGVTFERFRGGSGITINTDHAYAIPVGARGMFVQAFGPADFLVNDQPPALDAVYVRPQMRPDGRGWTIELQSNPLTLCLRPEAVIKLTRV